MNDNNFVAFQYALGLLSTAEKQAIKKTIEFEQALQQWRFHLAKLNLHAPLSEESALRIWQNVNAQIKQEMPAKKFNIIHNWLNHWRYMLGGFATLGLLFSIGLFNQNVHAKSGWDIQTNLSQQRLTVTPVSHQHSDPNLKCNLWVKKGYTILYVGLMPESGQVTFDITQEMLRMIKNGELIISLEKESRPTSPSIISYQQKWIG